MMTQHLTHMRDLRIMPDVAEMRVAHKVIGDVAAALHSFNRQKPDGDKRFIAIDLPDYDEKKSGNDRMGTRVRLLGSPEDLESVMNDNRISGSLDQGLIYQGAIVSAEPEKHGLLRIRTGEKTTEAGHERARRRFERRAEKHPEGWQERGHRGRPMATDRDGVSFLNYSKHDRKRITFKRVPLKEGASLSTYGMTGKG